MTIELHPIGLKCNLACTYCYQENMRPTEVVPYINIRKMLRQVKKQGNHFTVFGGEPLLTPIKTLEILFAYGFRHYGQNGIQTNGTLITDRHMEMFKKYNVHVGVSIDGPSELNDERVSRGSPTATRVSTWKTQENLERLLREGVACSIIVTIYRANAAGDKLDRLESWLRDLAAKGLRSARIHLMELDNPDKSRKLVLTAEENATAILRLSAIENLDVDLISDMRRNLENDFSRSSCIWHGCDPLTTPAVIGIDADGTLSNCGRVNKGGVNYRKSPTPGRERVIALYNTPYEKGGCKDCRFFLACKGQCPGTGIDGDWRNRTEHCGTLMILFEQLEKELVAAGKVPISLSPDREKLVQDYLSSGTTKDSHADWHEDWHGDVPHGDSDHGDIYQVPVGRPK